MKRYIFSFLSIMLVLSFVLTACGAPKVKPPSGPVTLAFWEQEGADVDTFIDGLIANFQTQYPKVGS